MTQRIYCGNNIHHGNIPLGTRYSCMQKGIGRGVNMPWDPTFAGPYQPIDDTKVYCGNSNQLPANYDRFGNLPTCLQKGIGIGKRLRIEQGFLKYFWKAALTFLGGALILFITLKYIDKIKTYFLLSLLPLLVLTIWLWFI